MRERDDNEVPRLVPNDAVADASRRRHYANPQLPARMDYWTDRRILGVAVWGSGRDLTSARSSWDE